MLGIKEFIIRHQGTITGRRPRKDGREDHELQKNRCHWWRYDGARH